MKKCDNNLIIWPDMTLHIAQFFQINTYCFIYFLKQQKDVSGLLKVLKNIKLKRYLHSPFQFSPNWKFSFVKCFKIDLHTFWQLMVVCLMMNGNDTTRYFRYFFILVTQNLGFLSTHLLSVLSVYNTIQWYFSGYHTKVFPVQRWEF